MKVVCAVIASALFLSVAHAQECGFQNEAFKAVANTAGSVTKLATDKQGRPYVILAPQTTNSAVKAEDSAFTPSDPVVVIGGQIQNSFGADTSADGDVAVFKFDRNGRAYINPHGSSPDNFFTSCSSANTGTSDVAIKAAAGASIRMYITSISCANTAAVASSLSIKDGTTVIDVGAVGTQAATGGGWTHRYPVPLRGSANTALNFAMTTTATSTTCCAQGYTSTN